MKDTDPTSLDSVPRLYALHRDDDDEESATVVAWGLAFPGGRAVTLWLDPHPGAGIAIGSVRTVEERYAPIEDAYLVWVDGAPPEEDL